MGLLEKISAVDLSTRLEKNQTPQPAPVENATNSNGKPSARCPVCLAAGRREPYGRHFWRDSYGYWHCTECELPATLAQVREEISLRPESDNGNFQSDDPEILTLGDEAPVAFRGRWRAFLDFAGRWGWEPVDEHGLPIVSQKKRWWLREAV